RMLIDISGKIIDILRPQLSEHFAHTLSIELPKSKRHVVKEMPVALLALLQRRICLDALGYVRGADQAYAKIADWSHARSCEEHVDGATVASDPLGLFLEGRSTSKA